MEEDHNKKLFHALNLYESFVSSPVENKEVIDNYLGGNNSPHESTFFSDLTKLTTTEITKNTPKLEMIIDKSNINLFNASNTLLELLSISRVYNLLSEYLSLSEMVGFYILVNNINQLYYI